MPWKHAASALVLLASMLMKALSSQDVSPKSSTDEMNLMSLTDFLLTKREKFLRFVLLPISNLETLEAAPVAAWRRNHTCSCVPGPDPDFLNLTPDYLEGITLRSLAVICADID